MGFAVGQYVELYPTIQSSRGGSTSGGTRGIIRDIDLTRPGGDVFLVAFLQSEQLDGEQAWLGESDLFPA